MHKHDALGFRLFLNKNGYIKNPTIGSWEVFSKEKGVACTTGNPFKFHSTAKPLYVEIAYGELEDMNEFEEEDKVIVLRERRGML